MLAILFPHMYEDVEYLIPGEVNMSGEGTNSSDGNAAEYSMNLGLSTNVQMGNSQRRTQSKHENAVAGPSRLG